MIKFATFILLFRGSRVRELWRYLNPAVAQGRQRPLPLQRLRSLLQNERAEPAAHQAQEETGKTT